MKDTVKEAFKEFEQFMEEPKLFMATMDCLPCATQLSILRSLYQEKKYFKQGNVKTGEQQIGKIYQRLDTIMMDNSKGDELIIAHLPPEWDWY